MRPTPLVSDYDRLLDGYLASREGLKSDADFAQAFAHFTDCENYTRLRANEFRTGSFQYGSAKSDPGPWATLRAAL